MCQFCVLINYIFVACRAEELGKLYRQEVLKRKATESDAIATAKKLRLEQNKVRLLSKKNDSIKELKTQILIEKTKAVAADRTNDRYDIVCLIKLFIFSNFVGRRKPKKIIVAKSKKIKR